MELQRLLDREDLEQVIRVEHHRGRGRGQLRARGDGRQHDLVRHGEPEGARGAQDVFRYLRDPADEVHVGEVDQPRLAATLRRRPLGQAPGRSHDEGHALHLHAALVEARRDRERHVGGVALDLALPFEAPRVEQELVCARVDAHAMAGPEVERVVVADHQRIPGRGRAEQAVVVPEAPEAAGDAEREAERDGHALARDMLARDGDAQIGARRVLAARAASRLRDYLGRDRRAVHGQRAHRDPAAVDLARKDPPPGALVHRARRLTHALRVEPEPHVRVLGGEAHRHTHRAGDGGGGAIHARLDLVSLGRGGARDGRGAPNRQEHRRNLAETPGRHHHESGTSERISALPPRRWLTSTSTSRSRSCSS